MNTPAKTFVRGDCYVEGFDGGGGCCGFCLFEYFRVGETVLTGLLHCSSGIGQSSTVPLAISIHHQYLATTFIVFVIFSILRMDFMSELDGELMYLQSL